MIFEEELRTLTNMSFRDLIKAVIGLGVVVSSAVMLYKILTLVTWCESPFVVVVSGSMEPGYFRGDLVLLASPSRPVAVGDIAVFKLQDRDIPIVHRIHRVHEAADGELFVLTKGDNNRGDDRNLYDPGQDWISTKHIVGRSTAYVPYVGWLTVLLMENLWVKVCVLGLLAFTVITSHEEQV